MRLQDLPDEVVRPTEAFIFFASLSSGVRHFVASIGTRVTDSGFVVVDVCIEHDEVPLEWCEDSLSYRRPVMPGEAGFTASNPPLPRPDKVFVDPDAEMFLQPCWN